MLNNNLRNKNVAQRGTGQFEIQFGNRALKYFK